MNKRKTAILVSPKVSIFLFLSDILSVSVAFLTALSLSHFVKIKYFTGYNQQLPIDLDGHYDFLSLIIYPVILTLFYIKGHYTKRAPWWDQVRYIFGLCLIAFASDIFIRLILDVPLPEFLITLSAVLVFAFILIGRLFIYFICKRLGLWQLKTVIIGGPETVSDILYGFNADHYTGYDVQTIILRPQADEKFNINNVPKNFANIEIIDLQTDYLEFINQNPDHFFVISLDTFQEKERNQLVQKLTDMNVLYSIAPSISKLSVFEMKPQTFFGCDIILLPSRDLAPSPFKRFTKRTMDIIGASVAMILFAPFMLLIMLFLKIEGQNGSLFYGGQRIGRHGKLFNCWKFRSMEPNSDHLLEALLESDPDIKAEWMEFRKLRAKDPRVTTRTAHIIRKLSLDELPQFWNVFRGHMSLVGPRPILESEKELLEENYSSYIKVRPGITGLWQVSGRNDTSFQRRIHMDSWYVRNWSIWGDIVIIIKTLKAAAKGF